MTRWCGLFLTLILLTGCGGQAARSAAALSETSQPSVDRPKEALITREKAIELGKQIAQIKAEVKWQAIFDSNREIQGKDGPKVHQVWAVEAVFPLGNKETFFIDAISGEYLGTMSVEAR